MAGTSSLLSLLPLPPPLVFAGRAGSAATMLCPPSGRHVRAAMQALLLPVPSIVRRMRA